MLCECVWGGGGVYGVCACGVLEEEQDFESGTNHVTFYFRADCPLQCHL